jgi:large subunit ribosomal protein L28
MISYLPMSSGKICENCRKGSMYGHEVSHAKNRSKRLFEPNLHTAKVMFEGRMKRVKLCTKCLRKMKKELVKTTAPKVEASIAAV